MKIINSIPNPTVQYDSLKYATTYTVVKKATHFPELQHAPLF